jgi:DNA-binding transcriptional ArsR family regulator
MKGLWLRLYVDVLNNRKVQTLPDSTFKFWINLLCAVKESQNDGTIPDIEDIAFKLRLSKKAVEKHLKALRDARLIDDDIIHDWQELQPKSDEDPTAKDRKARQRGKEKEVTEPVIESPEQQTPEESQPVTPHVTRDIYRDINRDSITKATVTAKNVTRDVTEDRYFPLSHSPPESREEQSRGEKSMRGEGERADHCLEAPACGKPVENSGDLKAPIGTPEPFLMRPGGLDSISAKEALERTLQKLTKRSDYV